MLKIRLQRIGKRGQAYFKVIVTEHTQKPKGKYLELLGSYDPHKNEINVDAERVKHWIGQGAHMSDTVNNLLVGKGVVEGEKVKVWKPKKKPEAAIQTSETAAPTVAVKEKIEEPKVEEPAPEANGNETKKEETAEPIIETPAIN